MEWLSLDWFRNLNANKNSCTRTVTFQSVCIPNQIVNSELTAVLSSSVEINGVLTFANVPKDSMKSVLGILIADLTLEPRAAQN